LFNSEESNIIAAFYRSLASRANPNSISASFREYDETLFPLLSETRT